MELKHKKYKIGGELSDRLTEPDVIFEESKANMSFSLKSVTLEFDGDYSKKCEYAHGDLLNVVNMMVRSAAKSHVFGDSKTPPTPEQHAQVAKIAADILGD